MRFAFFRPNDLREAVRLGTASGVVWEKNVKVAVLRRSYKYYNAFLAMSMPPRPISSETHGEAK